SSAPGAPLRGGNSLQRSNPRRCYGSVTRGVRARSRAPPPLARPPWACASFPSRWPGYCTSMSTAQRAAAFNGGESMSEELRVSPIETREVPGKRRFAMVVDTRRCIGCMACQVACKAEYDTPLGVNRTWVPYKVVGKYPNVKKHFLPRLCNHCDDPPCVRSCPVEATFKVDDGGFVLQRYERCIGCRSCMASCPYNARFMLP